MVLNSGILNVKEKLLSDVAEAFEEGRYCDITFTMTDGVNIPTNKFMLACRVPYFDKLLFGGLAENLAEGSVTLNCCDSNVFQNILRYVFVGEITFLNMSLKTLLDLMETARLMCIDGLVEGVEDYLADLLDNVEVNFKDALAALNFAIDQKFARVSELLLNFIGKNLSSIYMIPELASLNATSMKMLVAYEGSPATEIEKFIAFSRWLVSKDAIEANVKSEILNLFDLRKFGQTDLMKIVQKTKLFDDTEILEVLEEHMDNLEESLALKNRIIEELEEEIRIGPSVRLTWIGSHKLDAGSRREFIIPAKFEEYYVLGIEFTIGSHNYLYSYSVQKKDNDSDPDWTNLVAREDKEHGSEAIVYSFDDSYQTKRVAIQLSGSKFKYNTNVGDRNPSIEDFTIVMTKPGSDNS